MNHVTVRIDEDTKERIRKVSEILPGKRNDIMAHIVAKGLDEIEANLYASRQGRRLGDVAYSVGLSLNQVVETVTMALETELRKANS